MEGAAKIPARAVADAMLDYVPCPNFARRLRKPDFSGWGISDESAIFLAEEPNAFLIGAVFDRMITAEMAWEAPRALAERLGHFDVQRIARMSIARLDKLIGRHQGQPALHRFHKTIAECVVSACKQLVKSYRSNAANIWKQDPRAAEVLRRLQQFDGIGQKIANMTVRLLMTYYGVRLSGWNEVDVAVDRHVARVFLRTGLVAGFPGRMEYSIAEIRDVIIARARSLFPKYPGALDEPAFMIGKFWCTSEYAYCRDGEEPCPLRAACGGRRRQWQVV